MITTFWQWITSTVASALATLNSIYNNETMHPFFELLIIAFALGMTIKLIVGPIMGLSFTGSSDKVRKKGDDDG